MSSTFALRNELRSIVLRGVQRIRDIEIAREVAEFVLLEARMTIAASFDDDDDDEWVPSPEEIEAARTAINAGWSDEERERRYILMRRAERALDRYYSRKDDPAFIARKRGYDQTKRSKALRQQRALANREHINAMRRDREADPQARERKNAEQRRRYLEKRSERLARRREYNAKRRAMGLSRC